MLSSRGGQMGGDASWLGPWGQFTAKGKLGPPGHMSHAQIGHSIHLHPLIPHLNLDKTSSCPLVGQVRAHGAQCTGLEIFARGVPIKCRVSVFSQMMVAF